MESSKATGQFLVDAEGRSFWSTSASGSAVGGGSQGKPATGGQHQVEVYTGELCRTEDPQVKPVAAMSYGGRVRIARLHQSHEEFLNTTIRVAGWAKSCRAQKDVCFVELNDGSCFQSIQVVVAPSSKDFQEVSKAIVGASLSFSGTLIESPAAGQAFELAVNDDPAHKGTLIGNSDGTYPI